MDRTIVPYVRDDDHNAPKHLRILAYPQIDLSKWDGKVDDETDGEWGNGWKGESDESDSE